MQKPKPKHNKFSILEKIKKKGIKIPFNPSKEEPKKEIPPASEELKKELIKTAEKIKEQITKESTEISYEPKEEPKTEIMKKEEISEEPKEEINKPSEKLKEDVKKDIVNNEKPSEIPKDIENNSDKVNSSTKSIQNQILFSESQSIMDMNIPIDFFKQHYKEEKTIPKKESMNLFTDNLFKKNQFQPEPIVETPTEIDKLSIVNDNEEELKSREEIILNKEKEVRELLKDINTEKLSIAIERENLIKESDRIINERIALRKLKDKLMGHSDINKVLLLCEELKDDIIAINIDEPDLLRNGIKYSEIDFLSKKAVRYFSSYEFAVKDAKWDQSLIIRVLKILAKLIHEAGDNIEDDQLRAYYRIRGLLKSYHVRLNFFDNHIHGKESKPIELMRIFSALEPTIPILSILDKDDSDNAEGDSADADAKEEMKYEQILEGFNDLLKEQKEEFFKKEFSEEYIPCLSSTVQTDIFNTLLSKKVLTPDHVIYQLERWESVNLAYRQKFITNLAGTLTPTEKVTIAQIEIDEMKKKGLITL